MKYRYKFPKEKKVPVLIKSGTFCVETYNRYGGYWCVYKRGIKNKKIAYKEKEFWADSGWLARIQEE